MPLQWLSDEGGNKQRETEGEEMKEENEEFGLWIRSGSQTCHFVDLFMLGVLGLLWFPSGLD